MNSDADLEKLRREHALLNTIVNALPHYILWTDRNLTLQGCNERYAQLVGLNSPAEIVGRTRAQLPLVTPHLAEHFDQIDRRIMETGVPTLRIRDTLSDAHGKQRVYSVSRLPLQGDGGSIEGILILSEDITEEERVARKMREDEERWLLGLEVNGVAVWDFDLPGQMGRADRL
jgi:PAS domain S-box-containing protein